MEVLKTALLDIESAYTDFGLPLQREWEAKQVRDDVRSAIESAESVADLA